MNIRWEVENEQPTDLRLTLKISRLSQLVKNIGN